MYVCVWITFCIDLCFPEDGFMMNRRMSMK